ncbi:hypothetical protein [Desulfovibrio falkowii]
MRAIAVLAFLCIASLAVNCFMAWRLSSAGKEIDQLRIESAALLVANGAGDTAYKVFEKGRSEALNDARQKLEQINGIPVGLTGPDLLDELRRRMGLYTQDDSCHAAGSPDAGLPPNSPAERPYDDQER